MIAIAGQLHSNWYACTDSGQVICFHPKLAEAIRIAEAKGFNDPIMSFGRPASQPTKENNG